MSAVIVPAEKWEDFAKSNSCMNAVEQKDGKLVGVKTFEHQGFIFTSFGTMYGAYGLLSKPCISAYRLLPLTMYSGETTTIYHDAEAIKAGLRSRGDLTGLIVSVGGKKVVCAEAVDFLSGLPATHPLSLAEAKTYNEDAAESGWRAIFYEGENPQWQSLQGHPVAVYEGKAGKRVAKLFWKHRGHVVELSLADDVVLAPVVDALGVGAARHCEQLALL